MLIERYKFVTNTIALDDLYRLTMILINIYYGGPLTNTNPYDGASFQGPGI